MESKQNREQPQQTGQSISLPSISHPQGGGAIRGLGERFSALGFTGTATFSIPIPTPAMRGLEPELALHYSSSSGNGIFGMGFSLPLSNIARKTSAGIPRYDATDIFILDELGELSPVCQWNVHSKTWEPEKSQRTEAGKTWEVITYRPRQEGAFSSIEKWTPQDESQTYWRVLTKENITHLYGQIDSTRVFDPNHPERVFQWLLQETHDTHGNKILYSYEANQKILNQAHHSQANRYLTKIEYGNFFASNEERFAFRLEFIYASRPDPFSSFRSGFEIRIRRRCEGVQLFHQFQDQPILTRCLSLQYESPETSKKSPHGLPNLSMIRQVIDTGYQTGADGAVVKKSLPPLELNYSDFDPTSKCFEELRLEQDLAPPLSPRGQFLPVDLEGDGLPGILYSDNETTLYWEPLGNGTYSSSKVPDCFPIEKNLHSSQLTLTSLIGDGHPDLLVRVPSRSGFYRSRTSSSWDSFRPLESVPVDFTNPQAELVDLNGNGLADLAVLNVDEIRSYASLGERGFGDAAVTFQKETEPWKNSEGGAEVLRFADIFGDGLSHRVRIRNGSVECWPCLGYGCFGDRIHLENAPHFGSDFDPSRLFLSDLDGSGTADIIYLRYDRLEIFFNLNGNGFSDATVIPLTVPYDSSSQINFADIHGNGTSCLILTQLTSNVVHSCYDFSGDQKPYLLTHINNSMGQDTRIQYTTSTKQYLEDKLAGHKWKTQLFFPVHVVDRVEIKDEISGSKYVSRYRFHEGYYDSVERTFRGFGFVESWDSEEFPAWEKARNDDAPQGAAENIFVPPTYSRTWYHTGKYIPETSPEERSCYEYWQGDPLACSLPCSHIELASAEAYDGETLRQGYVSFAGQVLRKETYGLDHSSLAANPYTVTETNAVAQLLQPRQGAQYAVFLTHPRESLKYEYERIPEDPRITQDVNLLLDEFGNVKRKCSLAYPRRKNDSVYIYPEQAFVRTVIEDADFINHIETKTEPWRRIGIPFDEIKYELEGLTSSSGIFRVEELLSQVDQALQTPLAYGQAFTPGKVQARLFSRNRTFFWDEALADQLTLGKMESHGLPHHQEHANFTQELFQAALGDKVDPVQLAIKAGYVLDEEYWWNRGLIQYYCKEPHQFHLPCQTDGAFPGVDLSSHLNPTSTVAYDNYQFLPTEYLQYIKGKPGDSDESILALATTAEYDYQSLKPRRITDPNRNCTELLFDPLGHVVATTIYGTLQETPVGDLPFSADALRQDLKLPDIIENPGAYLQNATTSFYYDLSAWKERQQPVVAIGLTRDTHINSSEPQSENQIQLSLTYCNGMGRIIESKKVTDPELETNSSGNRSSKRWITSGRTVYNNKGMPAEQFLPYFSSTADHLSQQDAISQSPAPPTIFIYDPVGRLIRTNTPKGFFSRIKFSPWEVQHFDEADTIMEAAYYNEFYKELPAKQNENEQDALKKAEAFNDTPTVKILNNLGQTVRRMENNLGSVSANTLQPVVKGSKTTSTAQELWDQLVRDEYLKQDDTIISDGWVTKKFQPYDADFQKEFQQAYKDLAEPLLKLLRQSCLTTCFQLDIAGRVIRSTDPRLHFSNVSQGTSYYNFDYLHPMTGEKSPLVATNADSGHELSLSDIFDLHYWNWSSRDFEQTIEYDRLHRPVEVRVKSHTKQGKVTTDNLVETFEYGESVSNAQDSNLMGQLYRRRDQTGILTHGRYGLQGNLQESTQQFTTKYSEYVNWDTPVELEKTSYNSSFTHNALLQLVEEITPDKSKTSRRYNRAGLLKQIVVTCNTGETQPIINQIQYNARNQRLSVEYENQVTTSYTYENTTQRLINLHSTRPGQKETETLQDITYTYDPVGNITRIYDATYKAVFHNQQKVEPLSCYRYDALYRLSNACGRQHPGINATSFQNNSGSGDFEQSKYTSLSDTNALEHYQESYTYDDSGNLLKTSHSASNSWAALREIAPDSNRLQAVKSKNGNESSFSLEYDRGGNQKQLNINNPVSLSWSCCENLSSALIIERPNGLNDSDYYTYNSDHIRTRKVSERFAHDGSVTKKEVCTYLGNYETREVLNVSESGSQTHKLQQTLRVMDENRCVAVIHYWEEDSSTGEGNLKGKRQIRYQLGNILDSVALELDETAQIISYEEYFPYGGTAYIAGKNQQEVKRKVYHYSGKERDDSTGLYYYGARYYAPWLGRWLSPDPAGTVDGLNLYAFVGGNPLSYIDVTGLKKRRTRDDESALVADVRYMTPGELARARDIANEVFDEAYANQSLFTDESVRFSSGLEHKLVGIFNEFPGAFAAANNSLYNAITEAGGTEGGSTLDRRTQYKQLRTKTNQTLPKSFPNIDFGTTNGPKTYELHHLHYKSLAPTLAVTSGNFSMATRGSGSSGYIGTHEGLFHLISSGNDRSIYTREIAGVMGLIKRMIASKRGINLTQNPNPSGADAWLGLQSGGKYSAPGSTPTTEFRSPSLRTQHLNAVKRDKAGGQYGFFNPKTPNTIKPPSGQRQHRFSSPK